MSAIKVINRFINLNDVGISNIHPGDVAQWNGSIFLNVAASALGALAIGSSITNASTGCLLFVDSNKKVGQNTFLKWDNTINRLTIEGSLVIVNAFMIDGNNLFLGTGAGESNSTGADNTFIGTNAGFSNNIGASNVFVGKDAGAGNIVGVENVYIGLAAGTTNASGVNNIAIGRSAAEGCTGDNNIVIGKSAASVGSNFSDVVSIGYRAGNQTTAGNNVFVGSNSGYTNTSGTRGIFMGTFSGFLNENGSDNIFLGNSSGYTNVSGARNICIGTSAGEHNIGSNNTFIGYTAGKYNDVGNGNTALGYFSGENSQTGSNNTFLGALSGFNTIAGSGNVYIGYNAQAGSDMNDTLIIDTGVNSDILLSLIQGNFRTRKLGITVNPVSTLHVSGSVSYGITNTTASTFNATDRDHIIRADSTSNTITINLPPASGAIGREYKIKRVAGANNVTVKGAGGELIDGSNTQVITVLYGYAEVVCNKVSWDMFANKLS